jgi:NADH:ubiquinone oxidoreductase subunit 3 (subunit A)
MREFFIEHKIVNSSFECGIENNNLTRIPFSLQFFLIGLIFIIFDLEVIILLNFLPFYSSLIIVLLILFFICFVFFSLLYE